jgi:hypothetical protein
MVSRFAVNESCKHLENETIAWELIHDSHDNTTEQRNCWTGDFYPGRVAVIRGADSCIQRSSDQSEIQAAVRDS